MALLLLLLLLCQFACLPLVLGVLRILAGGDGLGQPRRPLEEEDQARGADKRLAVQGIRGVAAPLVQDEPDNLLGQKVGMPALGPQVGGDKSSIEALLVPAPGQPYIFVVLVLGGLIRPLLPVAGLLGENKCDLDGKIGDISRRDLRVEARREQDCVGGDAGEGEQEHALDERDEYNVEKKEGDPRGFALDDFHL